ncbi:hypothetical protein [Enterococcus canintestini]|uniref:Uncharacterized protein n=1 Tax=Enterococcus canintestini TaxID=317010 RepID=A0A267HUD7_9ENTE|nr:hypothetical protein [Enterococcus canintestini]PAB01954.1 hypothetical protein AKL21_00115 [Enterococcus canintestini]
MKTALTLAMEEALYFHCRQKGDVVIEEVVMPDDQGIVDTLACKILPNQTFEWRCYELKVTKADFRSTAKLSFVGHLNYFVLPQALYEQVKEEIPAHIGVLLFHPYLDDSEYEVPGYFETIKKAQRQTLQVNENELLYRLITAQAREVSKAKQTERGLRVFGTQQLYKELKRRQKDYDLFGGGNNYYDRFIIDTQNQAVEALKEELEATRAAYFQLEKRLLEDA